jgi:hypothetical protein
MLRRSNLCGKRIERDDSSEFVLRRSRVLMRALIEDEVPSLYSRERAYGYPHVIQSTPLP